MAKKSRNKSEQRSAEEQSAWASPRSYKVVRVAGTKVVPISGYVASNTQFVVPKMPTPEERAASQKEAMERNRANLRRNLGVKAASPIMSAQAVALEMHEVAQKLRRLAALTIEGDTQAIRQRYQLEVDQFDGDLDGISECLEGLRDLITAQHDDHRR